jgi:ABC-type nitrate/sulfonate/bicarbonate transport system substrate-binding protein
VLRGFARARFLSRVVLLALCVALVAATASGQERVKFPVGVGTKTLGTNAIFLATKKGFFDDFGLDVQPVLLRGTPITVQALLGESLYVALGSADSTIGAAATGVDLLSVGGVVNGLTQVIVAGKKYKTYSDLRGTTIGVQALTSGATNVLKRILKKNGLDYPSDYKLLAVGGGSFNLAALTSGQIAATYLVVPLNYSAEEQGFSVLGYYKDYFPSYQLSVLAVKRGWAERTVGSWCASSRAPSAPIAGSMRTKRRPSIFLPRRFHSSRSLRGKDGNTTRRTGSGIPTPR